MQHRFVTIAKFAHTYEADFYCSILRAGGFDAHTVGDNTLSAAPFLAVLLRIRLQVPSEQAEDATRFLRSQPPPDELEPEYEPVPAHSAEAEENPADFCPVCGERYPPPPEPRLGLRVPLAFFAGAALGLMQGEPGRYGLAVVSGTLAAVCVTIFLLSRRPPRRCVRCDAEDGGGGGA